ncbi:prephenate dehydratase [Actinocrinis puniceicyclus]|uniref:Prephenate dehydratase n=1 Tax=Actinocrinis puniceicyclus TaxID=977794 RepID=A0A8J7WNB3_9ACTN|nr:prephenate dehydratase [Actinocrinis puniceicyclus]MBS2963282.1 prephenate dehydratase [Actinocrinis puniceicyclus]
MSMSAEHPVPHPRRYAYLGPEGTFTEAALLALPESGSVEAVPWPTVPSALDAVRRGECVAAVVAMESSVEGAVTATMDELASGQPLVIIRELLLPVGFALLVRPGTTLEDVKTVAGHPVAEPQCRRWLGEHLPHARWEATTSNAHAARQVRDGQYDAALAGSFAAARYGLEVLAEPVHDIAGAQTRFVVVTRPGPLPPPTGVDKTSITVGLHDNHPGELMEILEQFATRGVNLCRIESRPTGEGMGRYFFFIDCEGHIADSRVGEALMGLRRSSANLRFLGSYPRADGQAPAVRFGTSDEEFTEARDWLEKARGGGPA